MLYFVAMLKPAMPLITYYLNHSYIVKVLCVNKDKPELACNGKCYLMQMIQKKQKEQEEENMPSVDMRIYPVGFVKLMKLKINESFIENPKNSFIYNFNYSYNFSETVFHPPLIA